jgi:hypothetical protein
MSFKEIPLTQGKVALVDEEDFEWLKEFKWYVVQCRNRWYAARWCGETKRNVYMHREIVEADDGTQVDHRDGDGLNNRRSNLREATNSQNQMNAEISRGRSKYRGVDWYAPRRRWRAQIGFNGRQEYIGLFEKEEDAARAYDCRAKELFGEFARLNFEGGDGVE